MTIQEISDMGLVPTIMTVANTSCVWRTMVNTKELVKHVVEDFSGMTTITRAGNLIMSRVPKVRFILDRTIFFVKLHVSVDVGAEGVMVVR